MKQRLPLFRAAFCSNRFAALSPSASTMDEVTLSRKPLYPSGGGVGDLGVVGNGPRTHGTGSAEVPAATTSRRHRKNQKRRRECAREGKRAYKTPEAAPAVGFLRPDNFSDSQVGEDLSGSIIKEKEQSECDACIFECRCTKEKPACRAEYLLRRKALEILRHLKKYHRLKAVRSLPTSITCTSFRVSLRQCFDQLDLVDELTIKTSSKIVKNACRNCKDAVASMVGPWKKKLFTTGGTMPEHLAALKKAMRACVPYHWNKRANEHAYIPNGHATSSHSRMEGGNWLEEEFSQYCVPDVVFSSGKPRIITKYSSFNTEVLTPLHKALYGCLRREGWILTGPPTNSKVQSLKGKGPLLSYDYVAATDNFNADVVRTALEVLREKAVGLTEDEVRCLAVLGELRFPGSRFAASRGQPMGSVMSFPLLCLVNKCIVDLSLVDLLDKKKMRLKEWAAHRCLINGDDLLLRSPTKDSREYRDCHAAWAARFGLVVNEEKTMVDEEKGEINSTLFENGELKKKTNLAALHMSGETEDVVRVAYDAASNPREFRRFVQANVDILARQSVKFPSFIPWPARVSLFGCPKIRRALRASPVSKRPAACGPLPVVWRPEAYDLQVGEECEATRTAVARVRKLGLYKKKCNDAFHTDVVYDSRRLSEAFKERVSPKRETILACLARYWENKRKEELMVDEMTGVPAPSPVVSDMSRANAFVDVLRAFKKERERITLPLRFCLGDPPEKWVLSDHG